jgi:hypothetical protein
MSMSPPRKPRDGLPAAASYNGRMKFRFAALAVCTLALGSTAPAQISAPDAEKPPADLERAVLARATEFYTLLLNHDYRRAEALVADDTKDYYYNGSKPSISKFDVKDVKFSGHLTRAVVNTQVTQKVMIPIGMPGDKSGEWTLTIPSVWKLENGNWYFFVDQSGILSPVGKLTDNKGAPPSAGNTSGKALSADDIAKVVTKSPDDVFGKVAPDKQTVTLAPGGTEKVTITNGLAGPIRLKAVGQIEGVAAKLDRTELGAGENAVLSIEAAGGATAGVLFIQVTPTGEIISIQVKMK